MSWCSPHGTPLPDWRKRTLIMGIMNLTPDSFSDGGQLTDADTAVKRAEVLIKEGADILDLGAESTRPGATPLDAPTELARLLPAIKALRQKFPAIPLSIDTYKADVALAGITAGADIVNDVEGGRFGADSKGSPMTIACAHLRCPLILMHRRAAPSYKDFWPEILADLRGSLRLALDAGVPAEQLWTDPGFGFGKTPAQNLMLVRNLEQIAALGFPVLLGTSRKSTLGLMMGEPDPLKRLPASIATAVWGVAQGCSMVRTHDVAQLRPFLSAADDLRRGVIN